MPGRSRHTAPSSPRPPGLDLLQSPRALSAEEHCDAGGDRNPSHPLSHWNLDPLIWGPAPPLTGW